MSLLWTAKKNVWDGLYDLESGFFGNGSDGYIALASDIQNATHDIQATTINIVDYSNAISCLVPKHPTENRLITIRAQNSITLDSWTSSARFYTTATPNNGGTDAGDGGDATQYGAAGGDSGAGGAGGAGWFPTMPTFDNPLAFDALVPLAGYAGGGGSGDGSSGDLNGGHGAYGIIIAAPYVYFKDASYSGFNFVGRDGSSGNSFSKVPGGGGGGGGNIVVIAREIFIENTGLYVHGGTGGAGGTGEPDGDDGIAGFGFFFTEEGGLPTWDIDETSNSYNFLLRAE